MRPVIRCIVGKHLGSGEYAVKVGDPLTLEQAEYYAETGWEVILDPSDMEAFARWEQQNRLQKPRTWRQWSRGE